MPGKKKKYNARFPPARIKKIMQSDEEVGKVAAPVPVIISRALELFVQSLLKRAEQVTIARQARTLTPSHLKQCIITEQRFDFLQELFTSIPDIGTEPESEVEPMTPSTPSTPSFAPQYTFPSSGDQTEVPSVVRRRGRPRGARGRGGRGVGGEIPPAVTALRRPPGRPRGRPPKSFSLSMDRSRSPIGQSGDASGLNGDESDDSVLEDEKNEVSGDEEVDKDSTNDEVDSKTLQKEENTAKPSQSVPNSRSYGLPEGIQISIPGLLPISPHTGTSLPAVPLTNIPGTVTPTVPSSNLPGVIKCTVPPLQDGSIPTVHVPAFQPSTVISTVSNSRSTENSVISTVANPTVEFPHLNGSKKPKSVAVPVITLLAKEKERHSHFPHPSGHIDEDYDC